MPDRRSFHHQLLALGAAGLGAGGRAAAQAAEFPNRPLRIVVPFAAGGGPDILARGMAARLAPVLGKGAVVIVENMVGAGGIVAAQNVARAAPDGHTLLMGASSHVTQKAMNPAVRFDPVKDFVHVTRTGLAPSMLVVAADAPYKSVDDLVAAARKAPGQLNYASGGVGSAAHLCAAALALQARIEVLHVPYKGSVEIVPALLSGAVQFAFPIASTAIPQIQGGKVRALAVTSARRLPTHPHLPTLVELFNAPELALDAWFGAWLPAGTPADIVHALHKAIGRAFDDAALRAESEAAGTWVSLSASPQEFTAFIQAETLKFEKIVKAARLSVLQ